MKRLLLVSPVILLILFSNLIAKAQTNQTVSNGANTDAAIFPAGCTFNWTNDHPEIGLAASGTGDIASFMAINNGANAIKATITAMPVSPAGFAYIPNAGSNDVSVVNMATNTVVKTITVGKMPWAVAINRDGSKVYVTNRDDGTISVISTATNTVTNTITVADNPMSLVIRNDGVRMYVANQGSGTISIINLALEKVIDTIIVTDPECLCMNADGTVLYIGVRGGVKAYSTTLNTPISDIITGQSPYAMVTSADGSRLYAINPNTKTISVIDASRSNFLNDIPLSDKPAGLAIAPDGSRLYITAGGSTDVQVINTATGTVMQGIPVGTGAAGIAITARGVYLYVAMQNSGIAKQVNTATGAVTGSVTVGTGPVAMGNFIYAIPACQLIVFTITVDPKPPTITVTGTPAPLSTTYGAASASTSVQVSGINMKSPISVSTPAGAEVSTDNISFGSTLVLGAAGDITPTRLYIRLKATAPVNMNPGKVVLFADGAISREVPLPNCTVSPAALTIFIRNAVKKYGEALASGVGKTEFDSNGLKNSEAIGTVTIDYGSGAEPTARAGVYGQKAVGSQAVGGTFKASNYTIRYLEGDIVVHQTLLTIKANDQARQVGTANPPLTLTYSGFVNNESVANLINPPAITTTAIITSKAGAYPIKVSGAVSTNYSFLYLDGMLSVYEAPLQMAIPNTFSPNSDGINDTWQIKDLAFYSNFTVSIYDRSGIPIFTSNGYPNPWDGRYHGIEVPQGTYYYRINLKNSPQTLSGSVTVIR